MKIAKFVFCWTVGLAGLVFHQSANATLVTGNLPLARNNRPEQSLPETEKKSRPDDSPLINGSGPATGKYYLSRPYAMDYSPDTTACGNFARLHAGNIPPTGHGQWLAPAGATWWTAPDYQGGTENTGLDTLPDTWVKWPVTEDTVSFVWQFNDGTNITHDTVSIYFANSEPAIDLSDLSDSVRCGMGYSGLNAVWPSSGYGYWADTADHYSNSSTLMLPDNYTGHPDSVIVSFYGLHYFLWITVNGVCRDTAEAVRVRFKMIPDAHSGGNYWPGLFGNNSRIKTDTVCSLNYQLHPTPTAGTGTWSVASPYVYFASGGPGAASSQFPYDTIISATPTDVLTPPFCTLIWAENNEGCTDSDTLQLLFSLPFYAFFSQYHTDTCVPFSITMNNLSVNALNYIWTVSRNSDTVFTSTDFNPTFSFTEAGQYSIELMASRPVQCSGSHPYCSRYLSLCSGVDDIHTTESCSVFPNPVADILFVNYHSPNPQNLKWSIVDIAGKTYLEGTFCGGRNSVSEINVSSLQSGLYFLLIRSAGHTEVIKFSKE
jgi:hypothetical protein